METWSDDDFSQGTINVMQTKANKISVKKRGLNSVQEITTISGKERHDSIANQVMTLYEYTNQEDSKPVSSMLGEKPPTKTSCTSIDQEREVHVNQCLDSCFTPPASPNQPYIEMKSQNMNTSSAQPRGELVINSRKCEKSTNPTKHEQITLWKQLLDGNSRTTVPNSNETIRKRSLYMENKPHDKKPKNENQNDKGRSKRSCPFYKRLPNTNFTVDAFSYGKIENCTGYFLSHYHSDHYRGITKGFNHGPIYCSSVTGNLLRLHIGVSEDMIVRLPFNQEVDIQGIKVVLLDANHCPGSAVFLFKLLNGTTYLHTGDFRASRELALNPFLRASLEMENNFNRSYIDLLYLDTTYCKEEYKFPSQPDVIRYVSELMRKRFQENPKVLIAVGTYT